MKNLKNKKGISLIVLILTIIVMIILATAIILSLNNSGIIGKANKAKRASDYASLKEYANVLRAEYELMSDAERTGYEDDIAYVNAKLEAEGYKERLNDDGILLTEAAVEAIDAGIKIGDVVTGYTLDKIEEGKTYPTSGKENTQKLGDTYDDGPKPQENIERIEYTTWKYIGIGENGEMLIAPDMVDSVTDSQKIKLTGTGGFLDGPQELNDICEAMYSTSKGTARSMNIEDVNRILAYMGPIGSVDYYDPDTDDEYHHNLVVLTTPKTIRAIAIEIGYYRTSCSSKLGGKYLFDYVPDYYTYSSNSLDILSGFDEGLKETLVKFIFNDTAFWLSSPCIEMYFYGGQFTSYVRYVQKSVTACRMNCFDDCDGLAFSMTPEDFSAVVRPVVSLSSNVHLTKVSDSNWSI